MPELPEVETTKEGLKRDLLGQKILKVEISDKKLRFPYDKNFIKRITGEYILSITRRAKYIIFNLSSDIKIISHLGMSGSYRIIEKKLFLNNKKIKHDHFILKTEKFVVIYNDPRRFGYILLHNDSTSEHNRLKNLGYEPLSKDCNAKNLSLLLHNKERNIKNVLMDQRIIAGLGNIYVLEALWFSGISPLRRANNVRKYEVEALTVAIKNVLTLAIKAGGTSLQDFRQVGGEIGYFAQRLAVYGRTGQPCQVCATPIKMILQTGRASFYCPRCQN